MLFSFAVILTAGLVWLLPRPWDVVLSGRGAGEYLALSAFALTLLVFWALASYWLAVAIFSLRKSSLSEPLADDPSEWPPIALLYTTCNDFQAEAAATCTAQAYTHFHVFILDDSTEERCRQQVDAFHDARPGQTTIIRRHSRQGFKAGNLNHALRGPAAEYPCFAVADADERLPADFLRRMAAYIVQPDVAFVQAKHAPNPQQRAPFAANAAQVLGPFWGVYCPPRNDYGFVVYLGHGALVCRDAWLAVGGFPEVVLEDLAFSAVLGTAGLRGVFAASVTCHEDAPNSYAAFKRQQERYAIGVTEVIGKLLPRLLRSSRLSLVEKLDFCLWCSPLFVPALCLLLAVLATVVIPALSGPWSPLCVASLAGRHSGVTRLVLDSGHVAPWSWHMRLYGAWASVALVSACLALDVRGGLGTLQALFLSIVPHLSVSVVAWRGILGYLFTGRTFSPPTGEPPGGGELRSGGSSGTRLAGGPRTVVGEWSSPRGAELCIGLGLAAASVVNPNLALLGICGSILLGTQAERCGWGGRFVRGASAFCFGLVLAQVVLDLWLLWQSPAVTPVGLLGRF